jgi:hypothetical protein
MLSALHYLLLLLKGSAFLVRAAQIVPGANWTDTAGNIIQAHGGGFLKVNLRLPQVSRSAHWILQSGSTYYWFGEDKSANSALFKAVSCYSVCLKPIHRHFTDLTS